VAVMFVGFLVGFITVLCIGNYFRAKRAQERQRQRRLAKQAATTGGSTTVSSNSQINNRGSFGSPRSTFTGGSTGSPLSHYSTYTGNGEESLIGGGSGGGYEAPNMSEGVRA